MKSREQESETERDRDTEKERERERERKRGWSYKIETNLFEKSKLDFDNKLIEGGNDVNM